MNRIEQNVFKKITKASRVEFLSIVMFCFTEQSKDERLDVGACPVSGGSHHLA